MFTCSECTLTYQGEPEYKGACAQCAQHMQEFDQLWAKELVDKLWTKQLVDKLKREMLTEALAKSQK